MVLDMFRYEGVEVVVSYFPVWEMFFSMHVLSNPEHHLTRRKWVEAKEKSYPDLIKEIRDLGEVTDSWILIIDSEKWSEIRQMEIVEMLHFFRNKNIYQWNEWVKRSVGKEMSVKERNRILDIVEKYYKCVFKNEEMILRPYLVRILQKEKDKCLKEGLWNWCGNVHSRLKIKQDTIVYKKNQEYGFEKKALNKIFITASTFVHPHLWMCNCSREIEVVKSVIVEPIQMDIPEDLVNVFKALGDKTRLKIVKLLLQEVHTTQELAKEIQVSEAAVSKHLKIMWEAGLVRKTKKGVYMEYEFKTEMIDFVPYKFYETMAN